ncbi:hypothetical protein [Bifidobacterium sp. ESL0745]|uniref:hypothetical protein n=1 Tax=Bifidobacterium sp. ESL0745 TaxID=2983226 RepID=UPI0023F621D6|nr:hypothetical protein [Bifidobacterium sp. ESL0745]MDF7664830.1 hypothetical protein [Bifidobacterium sp. ESL0745]
MEIFKYRDFTDSAQEKIYTALTDICNEKTYIRSNTISEQAINLFLNNVIFVIAKDSKADYIRPLIKASVRLQPPDSSLERIFNEIRDKQASLKNNEQINAVTINYPDEVGKYGRVLKRKEIELMVIERVINGNPFDKGCPTGFRSFLDKQPPGMDEDIIEDCQQDLALQMFDKNNSQAFWNLWDAIVTTIRANPEKDVYYIYRLLSPAVLMDCKQMHPLDFEYFIAFVKERMGK